MASRCFGSHGPAHADECACPGTWRTQRRMRLDRRLGRRAKHRRDHRSVLKMHQDAAALDRQDSARLAPS
jgi:hypothetical protein